jgi:cytosine/adenosine deaminase-related metal-dependent hydrolase
MGTLNGAKMLFGDGRSGAIEPHRRADLAIIELPKRESADPHELLFCDEARVKQTWCGGRAI